MRKDEGCNVENCGRKVITRGLCSQHYKNYRAGMELGELELHRFLYRNDHGRICTTCDRFKPWSEFYLRSDGRYLAVCKPCEVRAAVARKQRRRQIKKQERGNEE